jgi:hypothetical protein
MRRRFGPWRLNLLGMFGLSTNCNFFPVQRIFIDYYPVLCQIVARPDACGNTKDQPASLIPGYSG